MISLIIRRLLLMIPMLLLMSVVIFTIAKLQPGDAFTGNMDPKLGAKYYEEQREKLGLNDPIPMQYMKWGNRVLHGELGDSIRYKRPVMDLIKERMPNTVLLGTVSLIITYLLAFPLGILAGRKPYSLYDYSIQLLNYLMLAIPSFVAGVFAIYVFAFQIGIFPFSGSVEIGLEPGSFEYYVSKLYHVILPGTVLGLLSTAGYIQFLRNDIIENARRDYIRTARAKGLSESKIYNKHILRNSIIPIVTFFGADVLSVFGGAVITESIFSFPGIGKLLIESITGKDYPLMMALLLFFSFLGLLANLISDITYSIVDPRIKSN
ncbi:oligopeptide ABC transporter permease [Staphylococcus delphini]|uniref:Peptide ABC transporter permease n=1 Tax=Staphylococcus delphini TaxID=53344 RepID=A0AAX0QSN9_9STAP|nr:oligopeptide ABC transporter permease [Staphylococcus delphini]NBK46331.1 ABC transporter permease [Staphylococcus delphini]PCF48404.1 peptide ABC transporter permease [Staphylococcus delphini]PNZ95510.1 peptide ABC transporter permease [Staphylococcus delphini]RIZ51003.1 peptide ABC transporter permease [Staphylococcus delphini]VED61886.1 oligopeptide transport system permease [Staphylococcus delphini]